MTSTTYPTQRSRNTQRERAPALSATTAAKPSTGVVNNRPAHADESFRTTLVASPSTQSAAGSTIAQGLIAALSVTANNDPDRPALRTKTIEAWLGWAHQHARRYASRRRPADDLRQVAALGLIKAVDGYDPRRGARFEPYASVTIRGELKRHFRDQAWDLRVPRRVQELVLALTPAKERLQQELRRTPTVDELTHALHVSAEDVLEALAAANAYHLISLQTPVPGLPDGDSQLGDFLGQPDPDLEAAADRLALYTLLARLKPRDRAVLTLRFFGNETQSEIAAELGISQMHVSRLLTTALHRLRTALTSG
jgi:RNA polymerase sigma-B factor